MRSLVTSVLFAMSAMADTAPITDENLRMEAIHAIFPGMQVSFIPGKRISDASTKKPGPLELDSPDALAKENVYRVIGKAQNDAEGCASENMQVSGKFSDTRQVRFQLFRWPKQSAMLAVAHYRFDGANPAGSCWSVRFVARLEHQNGVWKATEFFSLADHHQFALLSIRMLDLTGDGIEELVVEPDFGGAGTWGSNLQVFDLTHSQLTEVLAIVSRISYETDEMYTQRLDVPRTIAQHGTQFCFSKTTMFEHGKPSMPPRVNKPCYRSGEGVDQKEIDDRNKLLKP